MLEIVGRKGIHHFNLSGMMVLKLCMMVAICMLLTFGTLNLLLLENSLVFLLTMIIPLLPILRRSNLVAS